MRSNSRMVTQQNKERFHQSLFEHGKIQFGEFRMKVHQTNPNAPLSPIYLNIRDLPDWLYSLSGDLLHDLLPDGIEEFDYVIGIPKAGEPIGKAFAKAVGKPLLHIQKEEGGGERKITSTILDPFTRNSNVILVDDLITKAHTKREAIESIEFNGLNVVATLVLYDREQGGLKELNDSGRKTYAVSSLSEMMAFFVETKKIKPEEKEKVMAYIKAN